MKISYLALDIYSRGGIQRYCQTQIKALREIVGYDRVEIYSLAPSVENPFNFTESIAYRGKGYSIKSKGFYLANVYKRIQKFKPKTIFMNHIKLFPYFDLLKSTHTEYSVGNVYGLEVWSNTRRREIRSLRKITRVISDAKFTANFIMNNYHVNKENISVIWDPVDINYFIPMDTKKEMCQKYGIPYKKTNKYLMTVGRLSINSRHKGYDRMIDIMKKIQQNDVFYIIGGDGDDLPRLLRRIEDEGLSDRIFIIGRIPEIDLVKTYNLADIFILISDRGEGRGEGVPLTPLEAGAAEVPILVGNEDGSAEAVIDGYNGYVLSPRNQTEIIEKLTFLIKNDTKRIEMGKNARKHVVEQFSYEKFKERTEKTLDHLCTRGI